MRNMTNSVKSVTMASKFPRSQGNKPSVGCVQQTSLNRRGPNSQLTILKGSSAKSW